MKMFINYAMFDFKNKILSNLSVYREILKLRNFLLQNFDCYIKHPNVRFFGKNSQPLPQI